MEDSDDPTPYGEFEIMDKPKMEDIQLHPQHCRIALAYRHRGSGGYWAILETFSDDQGGLEQGKLAYARSFEEKSDVAIERYLVRVRFVQVGDIIL